MLHRSLCAVGALLLVATAGCESLLPSFYSVPLRQGNYIDQALIDQLRPGMTRQQVQQLLGTPLVADPFHQNRWDYYYSYRQRGTAPEQRHIALFFTGDTLDRVDSARP
ncbi:MAG: outer membrane protein assembly factor BamE [Candidatus Contendobacter sp.]